MPGQTKPAADANGIGEVAGAANLLPVTPARVRVRHFQIYRNGPLDAVTAESTLFAYDDAVW